MDKFIDRLLHNKTIRDGGVFAFFSFLNQGLNFFLLIILSWYILPASYGKLNLFYTSVSVVSFVICLCTSGIVSIKYFKVTREILLKYINVVLLTTLIISGLLLLSISFFYPFLTRIANIELSMQIWCVYLCAVSVMYNLLLDIYRLEEKSIKYGVFTIISTLLNICASLILVVALKQDWYGRVEANIITSTAFLFIGIYLLFKKKYLTLEKPTKEIYKETLSYGIPLIPHSSNGFLRQGMDRYIINSHFTSSSVGLFSFAINFAFIIYSVGSAFNKSNSVYIYKSLSYGQEGVKAKLRKQTVYILVFYLGFSLLLCILCRLLIPILFPNYKDSVIYLFPLCMSCFFQCVYLQFCNFLFYFKKTKELMYMTVGVSLVHLPLSLLLTRYSVLYAAYISMLSSFIEALLVYAYSRKLYKII
ncbi:oligosaccharide flippase family protein [Hoylesella pleuritidis]|uniref:lipopolysaccharide biosynthesis protein n=1 Tax=Hoylesella pleuritidis TaxID=407975 RepID=UPI0028EA1C8F|nr:oligosaccharide flippase family protein [Hoylesella pleuritidis]